MLFLLKFLQVLLFFSCSNQLFGLKMGHKIKDINKRLSEVASRRPNDLKDNCVDTQFIVRERVNHSFVPKENIIIGRDEDVKAIIQLLLGPNSTENVSTISIVGFGGLGKTALARLIFNDDVIQNHFELKIWTCVSNVFELDIVVKKILQSEHNGIEQLQNELRRKVDGKKYLLVLDDVWNEEREKWLNLKYLLMGGGKGSRILITTRSEIVATTSDTKPYTLRGLDEKQSWSLFKEMAFIDGKELENSTIKEVGMEVARKCKGVPLAIRTMGGMLRTKHHEIEWFNIKDRKLSKISKKEDDILPTLKLSYDVLPSHLKHCFAYCSLFPPDYEISVPRLIRLWVAQGFIESCDENECLEDVAFEYYRELLCRSFFQEEKIDEFGIIRSCKLHDLMNELAILVSGVGSVVVDLNQKNFHEKLRHLSFNFDIDLSKWEVPTSLLKASKIRTFLFLQQAWGDRQSSSRNAFYTTIISNFKLLRMLSLNNLRIKRVPKCLKKMKHLRYLDLSRNMIKRLPDWIVELLNLETLDLTACRKLVELPRDIKKMINLRHLILEGCWELSGMPRGIGELNGVRTLNRFVLSESNCLGRGGSAGLAELGTLNELRGRLLIYNLRHVVSESNVGTPLKDKQHLHSLELFWKYREDVRGVDEEDIIKSMEVLQPHSNLKQLLVYEYRGVRFASWFSSLINIVNLRLYRCERCQRLPPLDHLPSLKKLELEWLEKLEYISENERSNSISDEMMRISFFPSLETLKMVYCPVLKGWWRAHTHNSASSSSSTEILSLPSFPSLSTLSIDECPNLTSMPLYPNLERVDLANSSWKVVDSLLVRGASDITHDVGVDVSASSSSPHLSKLTHLTLNGIEDLEFIPSKGIANLTSLQELVIKQCPNLAALREGIANLTSLQSLRIKYCPNLAALPEGIANLTSLQSLKVEDCPNLAALPEGVANLTSLHSLRIEDCPNLVALPEGIANLTSLQSLRIEDCPNLAALPEGIANLTSLQSLSIGNFPNLAALPEGIANLTSLQSLSIGNFPNLAALPEEISNLTSLRRLQITHCSDLASLPEGIRGFPCLNALYISDCPMLLQRYKKETDDIPYGSKISSTLLLSQ
ncbi:disease resistance protein RGA2-like isoform X1 [Pyrus x bretschneideri]|uniref:disease resistance protein RGA2-like isoform X1 n=1 Tax=Pyrus x bretschneideri TaxID=225117 RepID=UPI002030175F|nr:disease resistance protein RGA2-like isoform X1 [Pyrus x bretschneideri]XP_048442406.1 disease resistance protein RGA2-like isoform X1 [Pyrus x bretschneideri]